MNASSLTPKTGSRPGVVQGIAMRFGAIVVVFALQGALLFGGAGRLDWLWAWVYFAISLATVLINSAVLLSANPEIVAERGRPKEMKRWDAAVSAVTGLAMYVALPLAAGLDARFAWTSGFGLAWHVAGAVVLAAGYGLFAWAMISNAFFSTAVRIQSERGHAVCRTGPYRWVRHPGYVGFVLQSVGMPLLLGSLWAFLPALAAAIAMVVRTALEDRMLQAELPGYREYAQDVRCRLVPGIW